MPDAPRLATPSSAPAAAANSYDEVPYDSHPFSHTHPARVATVATLFGLDPPPVETCRVLELGCASGGNLVPMAEALPDAWFVGVDYSARQIADGERVVRATGLKNVSLRHASILDIDETYGPFDYIICHGVFSWVPDAVRDKILDVCRKHLTPSGVAYISYNTYPGWHMRGMIRDMMRYHATRFDTPALRVQQARALLDFLAQSSRKDGGAYTTLLRSELENLSHQADHYLYHEHLEDVNNPLYFHQFVELAARHNLRYLGEARLTTMVTGNFGPEVEKALGIVAENQIQAEQYMDFVRNRTFRETLLVRADATPNWSINPDAIRRLHITSARRIPDDPGDVRSPATVQYRTASGMTLSTASPALKAAMRILSHAGPRRSRLRNSTPRSSRCSAASPMAARIWRWGCSARISRRTCWSCTRCRSGTWSRGRSPLRWRRPARLAAGEAGATTRRHEFYKASDLDRQLIPLLDGTRDRAALVDRLAELTLAGELNVERQGQRLTDPAELRETLVGVLDTTLTDLGKLGLLAG